MSAPAMIPYRVSFVMAVGCAGMAEEIKASIQKMLAEHQMGAKTIASVNVTQVEG